MMQSSTADLRNRYGECSADRAPFSTGHAYHRRPEVNVNQKQEEEMSTGFDSRAMMGLLRGLVIMAVVFVGVLGLLFAGAGSAAAQTPV